MDDCCGLENVKMLINFRTKKIVGAVPTIFHLRHRQMTQSKNRKVGTCREVFPPSGENLCYGCYGGHTSGGMHHHQELFVRYVQSVSIVIFQSVSI